MTDAIPRPRRRGTPPTAPAADGAARCVVYLRQSVTDVPGESLSIQSQERVLRDLAAERGYLVSAVYADEDRSGRLDETGRPGFAAAVAACKRGDASVFLVWSINRFARDLLIQERVIRDLARHKARVESLREPWLGSPFIRQVIGAVAEEDSRRIAADVTRGMTERARKGLPNAAPPFGYVADPSEPERGKRRPVPDRDRPERISTVRELFARYAAGEGVPAIGRDLDRRGLRPDRSPRWLPRTLYLMLDNCTYAGHSAWADVFVVDAHEAIVDAATWAAVQARRAAGRRARRSKSCSSWLEGLVFHTCGKPMYLRSRLHGRWPVFMCAWGGVNQSQPCGLPRPCLSLRKIEPAVLALLVEAVDRAAGVDVAAVVRRAEVETRRRRPDAARRRAALAKRRRSAHDRRDRARFLFTSGRGTIEEFDAEATTVAAELAAINAEEAALPAGLDPGRVAGALGQLRTAGDMARLLAAATATGDAAAVARAGSALAALVREVATVVVEGGVPRLRFRPPFDALLGGDCPD